MGTELRIIGQMSLSMEIRDLVAVAVDETRSPEKRDLAARRIPAVQAQLFPFAAWYDACTPTERN